MTILDSYFYKLIGLLSISLFSFNTYAQNWIDASFQYNITSNITYGTATNFAGGIDTLLMDIYTPVCTNGKLDNKFPVVIWIHGGSFLTGSKNDAGIVAHCKAFAQRGYVAVAINYRLGFISDDALWQCNFPSYECLFAADSAEWARAYHRAMQDANGAIRYLVNRQDTLQIDKDNIFIGGESAGAITALGVAFSDTLIERIPQSYALNSVASPHTNTLNCPSNVGKVFSLSMPRPDLGSYEGTIEPSNIPYTIKGVANIFGALTSDLLKYKSANRTQPAVYSFHQPCDIIVPIDSNIIYWGLNWCMNNGYNCYAIANTNLTIYGARAFTAMNNNNNYGYTLHNEFTTTEFPYNFLIGTGSCFDQANNPCHNYDNFALRSQNIINYFAPLVSSAMPCDTSTIGLQPKSFLNDLQVFPNPAQQHLQLRASNLSELSSWFITDALGRIILQDKTETRSSLVFDISQLNDGLYSIHLQSHNGETIPYKFIKNSQQH